MYGRGVEVTNAHNGMPFKEATTFAYCSPAPGKWNKHLGAVIGDKAPPATCESSEVARLLGFFIQDERMDVAQFAPPFGRYLLAPLIGNWLFNWNVE